MGRANPIYIKKKNSANLIRDASENHLLHLHENLIKRTINSTVGLYYNYYM